MFAVAVAPLIADTAHRDGTQMPNRQLAISNQAYKGQYNNPVRVSFACTLLISEFLDIGKGQL